VFSPNFNNQDLDCETPNGSHPRMEPVELPMPATVRREKTGWCEVVK